jgi:hypothetical protein
MRGADVFPSKYLKTGDLQGHKVRVLMASVQMEDLNDENKPVLYFHGKEKGLVLNKTKWNSIADLYGDDSDDWEGKPIVLAPGKTTYQGKRVDCIDIEPPQDPKQSAQAAQAPIIPAARLSTQHTEAPKQKTAQEMLDDEIPF